MKIGFVTVNYHSDQDTLELIEQLAKCSVPKGSSLVLYVVDNDKSEDLRKKLNKYKFSIYLDSPGNIGFAGGNNIGLKKCIEDRIDIIVMINNDTLVPEDLVEKISSSPITDGRVGVVGGLIYFAKGFEYGEGYSETDRGKVIWYAGGKYDWANTYASHVGVDEVDRGQYQKVVETDFITGCLFITRSDVLEKVGLFDERYCLYFEDSDLGMRISKAGYKKMFDPNIKIWHKVAQSSGIGSPLNDYFLTRNRLLFGSTYSSYRTIFALYREALRKLFTGTPAQKMAIKDFFFRNFGWGSFKK